MSSSRFFIMAFLVLGMISLFALVDSSIEIAQLYQQFPVVQYAGKKKPFHIVFQKNRPPSWVNLGAISREAISAILISEDGSFYKHHGFDSSQIHDALIRSWEKKRFVRGASTITQQVAKNLFLTQKKSLFRKLQEVVLSIRLEQKFTKKQILEVYFNIAEWGEGLFGIGPAAQYYFQKPPSLLTAKEGAFLAMLLPSPKRYSQSFRNNQLTPYARKTIKSILDRMFEDEQLSETQVQEILSSRLSFESETPISTFEEPDEEQE